MKVLFVANYPVGVRLEEMLYHGLIHKFGKENVIDYPYIPYFHGKEKVPYYLDMGWMNLVDEFKYSRQEVYAMRNSFDLAIIGSWRLPNKMEETIPDVLSWGLTCPIISVDGEDCPYGPMVQKPVYDNPAIKLYFSVQFIPSFHGKLEKCRPINFAVFGEPELTAEQLQRERPIDVTFSMGIEGLHPGPSYRLSVLELLKAMPYKLYYNTEGYPWANSPVSMLREKLLSSKIALSMPGDHYSYNQHQYYRVPYFGAVLLAARLPTVIVDDFVDWESAVFFNEPKEVPALVSQLLGDKKKMKQIAENGRKHLLQYHTSIKRVEYILKCLNINY